MNWIMDQIARLPWWLNPWGTVLDYRKLRLSDLTMIDRQAALIRKQDRDIDSLREQVRRLRLGSGEGTPSQMDPDFVIVGIPRPGQGVRVIASQKLAGTRFDMTPMGQEPAWLIRARMDQALFVDKATYQEAIAHVSMIWSNWARDQNGYTPGWQARPHSTPPVGRVDSSRARQPLQHNGPLVIGPAQPPGRLAIESGDTSEQED